MDQAAKFRDRKVKAKSVTPDKPKSESEEQEEEAGITTTPRRTGTTYVRCGVSNKIGLVGIAHDL